MDQELSIIITPDMASGLARAGWSISEYGVVTAVNEVPGFKECTAVMWNGIEPNIGLIQGGEGSQRSLVISKPTPDLQRQAHLARTIDVNGDRSFTLFRLIKSIWQKRGIVDKLNPFSLPMIDCVVCMPLLEGDKTYWAGGLNIGINDGAMIIIDKGTWNGSIWVTQLYSYKNNNLPIAPSIDMQVQVFSIDRILDPNRLTRDVIWSNSVTIVVMVSSLMTKLLLPSSTSVYLSGINKSGFLLGGFGNAGMGDNANTGKFAQEGVVPPGLMYPLVINLFPFAFIIEPSLLPEFLKQIDTKVKC